MMVRRAVSEDLARVDELLAAAELPALPPHLPLSNLLIAFDDGSIVGAIALEVTARVGLIRSAVVDAERRRCGIGSSLMLSLFPRTQELGLRELYLLTLGAQPFFEHFGFESVPRDAAPPEIRRLPFFRDHCPDSAILMRLGMESRI